MYGKSQDPSIIRDFPGKIRVNPQSKVYATLYEDDDQDMHGWRVVKMGDLILAK